MINERFKELEIYKTLRRIRTEKGLTQKQVADSMGVTESLVRAYESGRRNPKTQTVARFAAALGCQMTDLYGSDAWDFNTTIDQFGNESKPSEDEIKEAVKNEWLENMGYYYDLLTEDGQKAALSLVEKMAQLPGLQKPASVEQEGVENGIYTQEDHKDG